jgi:hypothetical protein
VGQEPGLSQLLLAVSDLCKEGCRVGVSGCQGCTYSEGWVDEAFHF